MTYKTTAGLRHLLHRAWKEREGGRRREEEEEDGRREKGKEGGKEGHVGYVNVEIQTLDSTVCVCGGGGYTTSVPCSFVLLHPHQLWSVKELNLQLQEQLGDSNKK